MLPARLTPVVTCLLPLSNSCYGVHCQSESEGRRSTILLLPLLTATTETTERTSISPLQSMLALHSFTPPHPTFHATFPCLRSPFFHLLLGMVSQVVRRQSISRQRVGAIVEWSGRGSEEVNIPK